MKKKHLLYGACALLMLCMLGVMPAFAAETGKIAFISDRDGSQRELYVMNADGTGQTRLTSFNLDGMGYVSGSPQWSPDGSRIAYHEAGIAASGPGYFVVINADLTGNRVVLGPPDNTWVTGEFQWSPDETRIAFSTFYKYGVEDTWIVNADKSGEPIRLTFDGGRTLSWSPDGSKIAYTVLEGWYPVGGFGYKTGGNYEIFVKNADGTGDAINLTQNSEANDTHPAWSPDGSRIAFASDRDGTSAIFVMNADGSDPVRLISGSGPVVWSPDGSRIAFGSSTDHGFDTYVMNADGTGEPTFACSGYPGPQMWAPNNREMVFTSTLDGNTDICVTNVGGIEFTRLTTDPAVDQLPAWWGVPTSEPGTPPTAAFSFLPTTPSTLNTVAFTDGSSDTDGMLSGWSWTFGDGTTSRDRNPTHTYATPGVYTVTLTVADDDGLNSATVTQSVTVHTHQPPVASFEANVTWGRAPLSVQFMDTSTNIPTSWAWTFGDGGTSTLQNPVHTYTAAGIWTVALTVSNLDGSDSEVKTNRIVVLASPALLPLPTGAGVPLDADADGLCEDVNGNGRPDFADVVLYFNQMGWIAANEPVSAFDYNNNGRIDFADVVWLFNTL